MIMVILEHSLKDSPSEETYINNLMYYKASFFLINYVIHEMSFFFLESTSILTRWQTNKETFTSEYSVLEFEKYFKTQ